MRSHSRFPHLLSFALLSAGVTLLSGCGADAPELPDETGAEAGALQASVLFDPAMFDSIAWPSRHAAMDRGGTVYAYSCARCHGDSGAGNGGYRLQGRLLRPPTFLTQDWRFARDPEGLREAIYTGTDRGMPHWGRAGLTPRDVDAVALYITRLWQQAE